jgi:gliding-associated putative ABC transporter substrate-binding component GldG
MNKILRSRYWWIFLLAGIILLNYIASLVHARFDLTKEKRYTLSKATKDLVRKLDDDLQIDVFLKGEFPSGFKKLAESTKEFLGLLKDRNGSKIHYRFISPQDPIPGISKFYADTLVAMGAVPINLTVQKKSGQSSNILFPVALLHYKGKQALVNLYPGASRNISQNEINSAEALLEYQFAQALYKMSSDKKQGIAYSVGNGEPVDARTYDLVQSMEQDFEFRTINLNEQPAIPAGVDLLMIVKPTQAFSENEKLKIDQFVMSGGKLICFIDNLIAEQDSLANKPQTIAYDRNLNLTDLFFKYGLRINTDLLMDLQCDLIPFVVGGTQGNPQLEYLQWNYYPFLNPSNPKLGKNQGYVAGKFVNSIDTIQVNGVRKYPVLVSSANSRIISTPALISLNENRNVPEDEKFRRNAITAGLLLEGKFPSLYRNRVTQAQQDSLKSAGLTYKDESTDNKMIVVADGDIVLNDYVRDENDNTQMVPIPMGWNKYTYTEYMRQTPDGKLFIPVINRDFVKSCVEYLLNNPAINETRNKDIVLRLLDSKKITAQKTTWQFINIGLPILLILLAGLIYQQVRKRKYQ